MFLFSEGYDGLNLKLYCDALEGHVSFCSSHNQKSQRHTNTAYITREQVSLIKGKSCKQKVMILNVFVACAVVAFAQSEHMQSCRMAYQYLRFLQGRQLDASGTNESTPGPKILSNNSAYIYKSNVSSLSITSNMPVSTTSENQSIRMILNGSSTLLHTSSCSSSTINMLNTSEFSQIHSNWPNMSSHAVPNTSSLLDTSESTQASASAISSIRPANSGCSIAEAAAASLLAAATVAALLQTMFVFD